MNSTHNNICNIAFLLSPLALQGSRWQLWKCKCSRLNKEKRAKKEGERGFNCKHEKRRERQVGKNKKVRYAKLIFCKASSIIVCDVPYVVPPCLEVVYKCKWLYCCHITTICIVESSNNLFQVSLSFVTLFVMLNFPFSGCFATPFILIF